LNFTYFFGSDSQSKIAQTFIHMQNIKPLALSTLVAVILHIAVVALVQASWRLPDTKLPPPSQTLRIQLAHKNNSTKVETPPLTKTTLGTKTPKREVNKPRDHKANRILSRTIFRITCAGH